MPRDGTANTRPSPSTARRSLRAADQPIETWSSCMAEDGIESTDAGTKPGGGLVAIGHTNSAGMFRMKTYKEYEGVVVGSHRVSVTKMDYVPAKRPPGVDPNVDIPPIATSVLPQKYKDFATSGLTASVTPKGSTQIRLDLE